MNHHNFPKDPETQNSVHLLLLPSFYKISAHFVVVLVFSAHFWLYFLTPVNITDAETDNIDENPLFDDENQHVLEIYQLLMWAIPFLEKLKKN